MQVYICPQGMRSALAALSMHTMHDKSLSSLFPAPLPIPRTFIVIDRGRKQTGHDTPSVLDGFAFVLDVTRFLLVVETFFFADFLPADFPAAANFASSASSAMLCV